MSLTKQEKKLVNEQIAAYRRMIKRCSDAIARLQEQKRPDIQMSLFDIKIKE